MKDYREEISNIDEQIKLLLGDFLDRKEVVLISDKFEANEHAYEFLGGLGLSDGSIADNQLGFGKRIQGLIQSRNSISAKIAKQKEKNKCSITDQKREKLVIDAFCDGINPEVVLLYKKIIEYLISLSKLTQYQAFKKKPALKGEVELNADNSTLCKLIIKSAQDEGETIICGNISGLTVYSVIKDLRKRGIKVTTNNDYIKIYNPETSQIIKSDIEQKDNNQKGTFVPADITNASYFLVAAALIPNSNLTVKNVLINKERIKYLEVLSDMGADINTHNISAGIEVYGDISSNTSSLTSAFFPKEDTLALIDEIPILMVAAAFAEGSTTIINPVEFSSKLSSEESEKFQRVIDNLRKLGLKLTIKNEQLVIKGAPKKKLNKKNIVLDAEGDYRMAMAYVILSLRSKVPVEIIGLNSIFISNPEFLLQLTNIIS